MNEESNKFLGEDKISKLLFKFSVPCILSLLISSLYNIVDQIFIGNSSLGYLGNAATTIVFPITVISMAFAWCLGDGTAAYFSLCQGRGDTKNANKAIGNSILVTFIISILLIIIGLTFMDKILYLFGASEASIGIAKDYFTIILCFFPFCMLSNVFTGMIRADGSPLYSMVANLAGAITNIILDPIFIFGFDMGIAGAAWATIIGQVISFLIAYSYIFKSKAFKLKLDCFKFNTKVFSEVVKLGVSTFITQMAIVAVSLVCNLMLVKYGEASKYGPDIPIAALGITMKVFSIVINIVVGIIVGGQPILGYNYGAKKYDRVRETFKTIAKIAITICIIATLIFELCPQVIIGIFGSESDLYNEFAEATFRIFLSLITFTCFIKMSSIFFQAVGNPVKAATISLIRDLVCFVPLVLILPRFIGIKGVLFAAPIADIIGISVTVPTILKFFKNLDKQQLNENKTDAVILDSKPGVIITIGREHGSQGKYIGELVAKQLNIPYYCKEMTALAAKEAGLAEEFVSSLNDNSPSIMYDLYLSTTPAREAIKAQDKVLNKIASNGSCVIVGRASDYVLRKNKQVIRIFIYAPMEYRIKNVMKMYKDNKEQAKKNILKSDKARSNYYKTISGNTWGDKENYDLCINSLGGAENTAKIICDYIKNMDSN